jgi:hypothetical protein
MYGAYGDCTAYATKGSNAKTYGEMLTKMNFHCSGNQILYNGYTGEQLYSEIFIGPTYYMRLKHMVKDKINYRATGKRSALTRQTNQGRANDGGLRIGEMERDGIMAHGLSYFLNESYMVRGDQYYMAVCNKTGTIAVYNPDKNLFLSPMIDGPLVFNKTPEGDPILDVFSKFGRSFSLLRIPYALKLLIQELQVMNVQMRIITEDNVDQLLNLSYQSKNISKLLHINDGNFKDINSLITAYKKQVDEKVKKDRNTSDTRQLQLLDKNVEPQKFDGLESDKEPEPEANTQHKMWYPDSENTQPGLVAGPNPLAWDNEIGVPNISENVGPGSLPSLSPDLVSGLLFSSPPPAPPDALDDSLKYQWNKLTKQEQEQILVLPGDQQETATKIILNKKMEEIPIQIPNYGSDGELNHYFAMLPRQEQIELLKLSHERQIEKLVEMAKADKKSDEFSNLRITIPQNKSSSDEFYESDKFKILAPAENKPSSNTQAENISEKNTSENTSGSESNSNSSSNIKKVTF